MPLVACQFQICRLGYAMALGPRWALAPIKMPPRGPVGLEGLVTYIYQVVGDGHVSTTYSGPNTKPFTYRDL
jgi:glutamate-5-semialdehyde dehydrogenase